MKDSKKGAKEKAPQVGEVISMNDLQAIEEKPKPKRKPKSKVYPRVDMIITNTRIGHRKTLIGPITGNHVVIIAKLDSSYAIIGEEKKLGIDMRDAEKIKDLEIPYRCARTRKWCKAKPFVIVT